MATAPVHHQSMASYLIRIDIGVGNIIPNCSLAEFRGPGIRHFEDHNDDYEMDMHHRRLGGGGIGRIIVLGDGTEVLTDHADSDMFDDDEEHRDLENQMHENEEGARREREGTPGPEESHFERTKTPEHTDENLDPRTPSSTKAEPSMTPHNANIKPATDSPLPQGQGQ